MPSKGSEGTTNRSLVITTLAGYSRYTHGAPLRALARELSRIPATRSTNSVFAFRPDTETRSTMPGTRTLPILRTRATNRSYRCVGNFQRQSTTIQRLCSTVREKYAHRREKEISVFEGTASLVASNVSVGLRTVREQGRDEPEAKRARAPGRRSAKPTSKKFRRPSNRRAKICR